MALSDNLISWWSLEEASGTRNDAHGTNHLTDINTVASATGKVGTAADFERGNLEYLTVASNSTLQTGDIAFSFGCWVNFESVSNQQVIIGKWAGGINSLEYLIYFATTDSKVRFALTSSGTVGTYVEVLTAATVSAGSWIFLVAVHDPVGNQMLLYRNAGTATTLSHSAGVYSGAAAFQLGSNDGSVADNAYDGLIDEAFLFKRVLSAAEITELYNSGNGRDYAYVTGAAAGQPTVKRMGGVRFAHSLSGLNSPAMRTW